ncbi:serine aminopeptidase S33 family [Gelidibacter sediminis]|uniref:Serine aminopeptidase S33 family n=1 Tax=Gelidibacter sediminis TaxID=1608710 RepID=A0A4R7PKS7_9FLAO|nr:alpha/beta hydrolase [Gelidibacter sediminis]TDU34190.1 serine aminopeptidase S33 family [Gelidibacter sediminis]
MKEILIKIIGSYYNVLSYVSKPYAADKALYLFMKPRAGKINEEQSDFLNTAFQEELKYDNLRVMSYRWLGSGQTILLTHGWESNAARWKSLIIALKKKGFNVVALDAPGHGKSGSKVFNAILYAEFINVVAKRFAPDIIVGHSVGGMAAALFQHKYQFAKIKKIILLGAPSEFQDVMKRYTDMLGYNHRIVSQLHHTIFERFGNTPDSFSTARFLETIESEGLIIHDEDDRIIPYNDALLLKNSFKNSQLITTKGLGHSLNDVSVAHHIYTFIGA